MRATYMLEDFAHILCSHACPCLAPIGRYRFKAIQRYHAAHEDIANAILKKDKALQKMFKKTDPSILQEIAEETVQSSGMDLYRQKKIKGAVDNGPEAGSSRTVTGGLTESPEQLRDTFAKLLKVPQSNRLAAARYCSMRCCWQCMFVPVPGVSGVVGRPVLEMQSGRTEPNS